MTQLFISDLHLSEHRPDLTDAFFLFLKREASQAQELYILGDLFEFWIGDDEQSALQQSVSAALKATIAAGCQVYFIHGNRDFMVGRRFANESGCTLLPELFTISLQNEPTLLLHGDLLCTDDVEYQKFRKITGWRWLRWLFLKLPLARRLKIAAGIRQNSKKGKQTKSKQIMDVTPATVTNYFQKYGITYMIHGHTHRPARHPIANFNKKAERIVLGDWDESLWFLKVTPTELQQYHVKITDYLQNA